MHRASEVVIIETVVKIFTRTLCHRVGFPSDSSSRPTSKVAAFSPLIQSVAWHVACSDRLHEGLRVNRYEAES